MSRAAVYVPTTGGPVRIERITRERAPQSMVCLKRTSTMLPISAAYDSFVRPGSGIIERAFGPFEPGAFRLDVSAAIDTGESWQLGVFAAHALCMAGETLGIPEEAEEVIWLTGQVDCDLAVGSVGHLAEKIHASRAAMTDWLADGIPVALYVREGPDYAAAAAAGIPEGARLVAVRSATEVLAALGLPLPRRASLAQSGDLPAPQLRKGLPAVGLVGAFATVTVAAVAVTQMPAFVTSRLVAPPPVASAPTVKPTPAAVHLASLAAPAQVAPASASAPHLSVWERRAPQGHTCAQVQFGVTEAVKVPLTGEELADSKGLCGLTLQIDNGEPSHVSVNLNVTSGKLLYGTVRPAAFDGQTAFTSAEWPIDLPRKLAVPFEFDATAAADNGSVARLHYRVTP